MRLFLDEMFPPVIAEQLRARGHDVVSVHEEEYRAHEGDPDSAIFDVAIAENLAILTENVADFRRLQMQALARGEAAPVLVFTSNRQFPRGDPATTGRLILALDRLLSRSSELRDSLFLERPD